MTAKKKKHLAIVIESKRSGQTTDENVTFRCSKPFKKPTNYFL